MNCWTISTQPTRLKIMILRIKVWTDEWLLVGPLGTETVLPTGRGAQVALLRSFTQCGITDMENFPRYKEFFVVIFRQVRLRASSGVTVITAI